MNKIKLPYKLLTFDIETPLLTSRHFQTGENVLRHTQLLKRCQKQSGIICIAAKWYHKNKVMLFKGDNVIEQFDKVAREADVCIGKNNFRFDNKRINTERLMTGTLPYPEWYYSCDDLESQIRKYFYFPSYSLDYLSELFGFGGKDKMEFENWEDIDDYTLLQKLYIDPNYEMICPILFCKTAKQVARDGKAALKKMYTYCQKDVKDTEAILTKVLPHIKMRLNYGASLSNNGNCYTCGSKIVKNGTTLTKTGKLVQKFICQHCRGYAGRSTIGVKGKLGRLS